MNRLRRLGRLAPDGLRRLIQRLRPFLFRKREARRPPPFVTPAQRAYMQTFLAQQEKVLADMLASQTPLDTLSTWTNLARIHHSDLHVLLPRGRNQRWPSLIKTLAYHHRAGVTDLMRPFRRSYALLLTSLNEQQRAVFSRLGYFWVDGRWGHYRIGPAETDLFVTGWSPKQFDPKASRVNLCVYTLGLHSAHLIYDDMLARMVAIETDEEGFLATANAMDYGDDRYEYDQWKRIERDVIRSYKKV